MRLVSVRLLVGRFDECFLFYRDILKLRPTWGEEGGDFASFDLGGGTNLSLFKKDLMARDVRTERLPAESAVQDRFVVVLQTDDLDNEHARLVKRGVEFINPPTGYPEYGIRAAHLRDPDGNLIELNPPLPLDEWSPELREEANLYGWN